MILIEDIRVNCGCLLNRTKFGREMVNNKYTLAWCAKENDVKNVQSVSEPVYVTKMTPHPASSIVRHAALRMFCGINDSINNITS